MLAVILNILNLGSTTSAINLWRKHTCLGSLLSFSRSSWGLVIVFSHYTCLSGAVDQITRQNEVWTQNAFTQQYKAATLSSRVLNRVLDAGEEAMDKESASQSTVNFFKATQAKSLFILWGLCFWFLFFCCCCNMHVCASVHMSKHVVPVCSPEVKLRWLPLIISVFWDTSLHWTGANQLARLSGQWVVWMLLSLPPGAESIEMHSHTQVCAWVLEIQPQDLIYVQLAVYLQSLLLTPSVDLFLRFILCVSTGYPGTAFLSGCEMPEGSESWSWVLCKINKRS